MVSRTGTRRIAVLTMVAMAFAMTAGSGVALAVNNHWTADGDGSSWTDGDNWELNVTPTNYSSNALLDPQGLNNVVGVGTVVIDGTAETATRLSVSGSSVGTVSLTIRNGGSLVVNSTDPFGVGDGNGTGTVTVESSASSSTFVKAGSFTLGNMGTGVDGFLNIGAGTFEGTHMNIGNFTGADPGGGFVNLSGSGTLSAIAEFNVGLAGQASWVNFDGGGTIKVANGLAANVEGKIAGGTRILVNGSASAGLGVDIIKTSDATHSFYNLANPIPEPTSLALLAMGLGGIGVLVRRKR